jgi:nicotinate dehydrogenase subunit A
VLAGGFLTGEEIHGKIPVMEAPVTLHVNGAICKVEGEALLIDELRDTLGLKGTRFGCGTEQCGACLVLVDGNPTCACTLPAGAAADKSVTTIEGLGSPGSPHPLQQAFLAEQAAQCGYCTSGMIVRAAALLARAPRPTEAQVREALDANLCRCGTYPRIIRAVLRAASGQR